MLNEEFTTKDSGLGRRTWSTGSRRDTSVGKPRPDLISPHAIKRLGELLGRGAAKYGERNWEKGQPVSVIIESAYRHLMYYMLGERDEDHLAAIMFNIQAVIHFEELAKRGDMVALEMLDSYASAVLAKQIHEERDKAQEKVNTTHGSVEFDGWGSARVVGVDWAAGEDQSAVTIQSSTP